MLKRELIVENDRLTRELARAIAANEAALNQLKAQTGSATYRMNGDGIGVPVPLTREQADYVRESILNSRGGIDAGYGENQELVVEPMDRLLPNFAHFVIRFDFDSNDGVTIHGVWGLARV